MSNFSRDDALLELKRIRENLLMVVNTTIDSLITRLENGEDIEIGAPAEITYPLSVTPSLFKGMKPTSVLFGEERVAVKTWRQVCSEIMQRCIADPDRHADLLYLRNKIAGKVRVILSDKPDGMNRPLKLADDLYFETFYDTEWLIKILTKDLLDNARFDYSDISVTVMPGRGRR